MKGRVSAPWIWFQYSVRAHEVDLAPVEAGAEHEAVELVVRSLAAQRRSERGGEARRHRVEVGLLAAERQHAQRVDHGRRPVARRDLGLTRVDDADAEVVDDRQQVREEPRVREVDAQRRGVGRVGRAALEVERELRLALGVEALERRDVAQRVARVGEHAVRGGQGGLVTRREQRTVGVAVRGDQGVEEAVLPARRDRLDRGLERVGLRRDGRALGQHAEEVEDGGALLEERRAVVDPARAGALDQELADAVAHLLAVALARQEDGRVVRALVAVGAQHEARLLGAFGRDHLADQRGVALEVAREEELDGRRVERGDERLVAVRARRGLLLGEDRFEALGEERHVRRRRAQGARREEPGDDREARHAAGLVVLLEEDAVEAPGAVDLRLDARLADQDDARVGEDAAQLLGHLDAALRLEEAARRVVAPHAEARAAAQAHLERVPASGDLVRAHAHEDEVVGDEPVEEAADLGGAARPVLDEAARILDVRPELAHRADHPAVVVGHLRDDRERAAQVGLERGALVGALEAREHLDVDERLAQRARAVAEAEERAVRAAPHRHDGVEEDLLGERVAPQRQPDGVDEEGTVVLEHLDDRSPRPIVRLVGADGDLAARTPAEQREALAGDLGERRRAARADGARVGARQEGAREDGERLALAGVDRARGGLDGRLQASPRRVRSHRGKASKWLRGARAETAHGSAERVDLRARPLEDPPDRVGPVGVAAPGRGVQGGLDETQSRAEELGRFGVVEAPPAAPVLGPLPDPLDRFATRTELGAARVGEAIDALAPALLRRDETFVLELLEGRVDGPGARPVGALGAFLEALHELVAVPVAFLEEGEQGEADLAGAEEAPAIAPGPVAVSMGAAVMAAVAVVVPDHEHGYSRQEVRYVVKHIVRYATRKRAWARAC
jgi:hypothetical protein